MSHRIAFGFAALAAFVVGLPACAGRAKTTPSRLPERFTPGIYLDPEEPALVAKDALRKVFQPGVDMTKKSEGWVPRLYEDAASYCTIGYGHLVKKARCDGTEPEEFRAGLTEPRGVELLVGDMELAENAVAGAVTATLTDAQYAALCDFVFNVGGRNFRKSTLLKVVNAGTLDEVEPQLLRWVRAGGQVLPGLKKRRQAEIDLFYQGLPRLVPKGPELPEIDIRQGE